jgi:hypothetical protein
MLQRGRAINFLVQTQQTIRRVVQCQPLDIDNINLLKDNYTNTCLLQSALIFVLLVLVLDDFLELNADFSQIVTTEDIFFEEDIHFHIEHL